MYKEALVTGGCGFLGRHFVHFLATKGTKVLVYDDLSSGIVYEEWPEFLKDPKIEENVTFVYKDVLPFLMERWSEKNFDIAVHLAAQVGGREAIEGKPAMAVYSMTLDNEFLRWCSRNKPTKIVYMSSSASYPIRWQNAAKLSTRVHDGDYPFAPPLKEDHFNLQLDDNDIIIGMPDKLYGWSKVSGEVVAKEFAHTYGLDILCPRPFSGYGEDQDMHYPFPSIVKRVLDGEDPIVVWGSGKQKRDFIHVDDLIQAIFNILPHVDGYRPINLGSGKATSFLELIEMVKTIQQSSAEVKPLPDKPTGVYERYCDNTEMLKYYKPQVSLEDGIKRTLAFLKTS